MSDYLWPALLEQAVTDKSRSTVAPKAALSG
jgi:hypothetical protein